MHALRRIARLLFKYKLLNFALLAAIAGLILQFSKQNLAAHWVLGTASVIALIPITREMWEDVRSGKYGIDILAVTAIVVAIYTHQYWVAIAVVIMFAASEIVEKYAEKRAKAELDSLLHFAPKHATVTRKGKLSTVSVAELRVGETIIITAGELVPVDVVIEEGELRVDESFLTGEAQPQQKNVGDQLLSGSYILSGDATAKSLQLAHDSHYEQILRVVRAAKGSQSPIERRADRYSIPFTIVAYVIALVAWYLGHRTMLRFLEVIVVATPFPLLFAAPIAMFSGISRAAKQGIFVKTGTIFEKLSKVKTIAFNKTGVLTAGDYTVDTVTTFAPYKKEAVLGLAAGLEQNYKHALAHAITQKAKDSGAKIAKAKHVQVAPGLGVSATVSGSVVIVGRLNYLLNNEVDLPAKFTKVTTPQTITYVAVDGKLAGCITFRETVHSESKQTIEFLHTYGIAPLMVTGDNINIANSIAKQLGIDDVHAEALPADKLHILEGVLRRPTAFVGDGVHDAPAITAADIGIALGAMSSTKASESADVVIMQPDLNQVAQTVYIATRSTRIAKQSIIGGVALSLLLMAGFATGHFSALLGVFLKEVVDFLVLCNALTAHGSWKRLNAGNDAASTKKLQQVSE